MKLFIASILMLVSTLLLAAEPVFQGDFHPDSFWTRFEGSWRIDKIEDRFVVTFDNNFNAKKAPDLKVFLSKKAFGEVTGRNAADSDSVLIAPLTTFTGEVSIVVPQDINPKDYQSILVHCEAYAKLWGGSPLRP